MKKYSLIYIVIFLRLNALGSESFNYWYHPHSVSIVGASADFINAESDRLNPSFIFNSGKFINLSFVQYPSEITSQLAQVTFPYKGYGLAATLRHMSYGIFKGYNEKGDPTSNYSASDTWVSCSIAKPIYSENINLGASIGYIYSNIDDLSSILLTGTTGISLNINKYKTNLGIALRNMIVDIKSYSYNNYYNPILINISASKQLAYLPLITSIDLDLNTKSKLQNIRLAGIFTLTNSLIFKFGTSLNRKDKSVNLGFFRDFFADTVLCFSLSTQQYVIDVGTYFYGIGGAVFSMGIGLKL